MIANTATIIKKVLFLFIEESDEKNVEVFKPIFSFNFYAEQYA
jgi:hypothetical protein